MLEAASHGAETSVSAPAPIKLNLGAGSIDIPGFFSLDSSKGDSIYPLAYPDESVEEVRASHVLEHFPHGEIQSVINDWVRVLKPGGVLKIAVPDFRAIAQHYLQNGGHQIATPWPLQGFVMGGQEDHLDYHKALFDESMLAHMLRAADLVSVRRWKSEVEDCASLPISLNLAANKPVAIASTAAVISMPRLGFNDFWACAFNEFSSLGIPLRKVTGAYWDRDLVRGIEGAIADLSPEWILTCDYDTVFTRQHLADLMDLARRYPHADAIAPLQTARHHGKPMLTARGPDGKVLLTVAKEDLQRGEMLRCETAHFGLTLLRVSALGKLPKPWMQRRYSPTGELEGDGAMDPDVQFWHNWKEAGNSLYIALRVPVGHCDLMIRWPDVNLETAYQLPGDYWQQGPPLETWR